MIEYLASPELFNALMNFAAILLLATMTMMFCIVGYVTIKEILDHEQIHSKKLSGKETNDNC